MKKFTLVRLAVAFSFLTLGGMAQNPAPGINQLIAKIGDYNSAMPVEKLFLQFDKPYYATGDTVWFKGYLVNETLKYSPLSSRLYVELLNDSNAVIKRFVYPVSYGLTWGCVPLDPVYVHDGSYTIRAYTTWMRNFSEDYFFKQTFYINNQGDKTWLVNAQPSISGDNIKLEAKLAGVDGKTDVNNLTVKVLSNRKVLTRNAVQTGPDGVMNVNFTVPAQTHLKNLDLLVQDKNDASRKALIPVRVNRPQDVDIQFMPESGLLVVGIPSHVGFKAVGEDGKGIAVTGTVYDNDHNEIAQLAAGKYGMGTFDIAPQAGKTYSAEFTLTDGSKKMVALPNPQQTGSVLSVHNLMDRDTITVSAYNTGAQSSAAKYFLVGISRGVVCYGASLSFINNHLSVRVPKALFPSGVAHFILLNPAQQPINERLTYIDHKDNLKIALKPDATTYNARDSVAVHISVKDETGKPVVGSLSIAVTDNNQVRPADVNAHNIAANLLLTSDLKGYVEDAPFYLQHTEEAWSAMDALLLTQGWVGYDLSKIGQPVKPQFEPEIKFTVRGTVTNILNKPIAGSRTVLLSKGDLNLEKDTLTDKQGRFAFTNFPPIGKSTFAISAVNSKGKTVNNGITIDEKNQTVAASSGVPTLEPWNVNTDVTMLNYVRDSRLAQENKPMYDANGRLLRTVDIKDRAVVRNSQNLNGGDADQTITEDVMVAAGKASLLDVLLSKVKNFRSSFHQAKDKTVTMEYFLRDKRVQFVFDGIFLDRFFEPLTGLPNEHYEFEKQYLDYISAEDVLGIEVIYSRNGLYNATLTQTADDVLALNAAGPRGMDYAFLEITTRSGQGPFLQRATGIYVYKPLELAENKIFYRPRYPVKGDITGNDVRSTIHWAPNIVTDKEGNATLSFYTADKSGSYTINCQGSDMDGKIGFQTTEIKVNGK